MERSTDRGHEPRWQVTVRVPTRIDFAGGWSDVPAFAAREGGAVVNAAITRYVEGRARWDEGGLRLEYDLALPPDAHLGTSGAINVAWLRLTHGLIGDTPPPTELAERAFRLEKLLGEAGGKQDQYAAALGGVHLLRFSGAEASAEVEPLELPEATLRALEARCVLAYSGVSSSSGDAHERVWERYRRGEGEVGKTVRGLRDSAYAARDALLAGDLEALAEVLTENREAARRLDARLVPPRLDELFEAGHRAGALGSKACGAGGGGCLLFLCTEGRRAAVEGALSERGATLLPFAFAPRVAP
ncbi:GHMP kinase [Truepera radiovictrix]|nr:GHMP kinase [Truepera radiovictrix]WMT56692.1 GHMP kinase [Truepera radiovictrix]